MTSSKTSSAPASRVSSRRNARKPAVAGTTPPAPSTGSTMTAASSPRCGSSAASVPSRSSNGATTIESATAAGMPGPPGATGGVARNTGRVVVRPVVAAREDGDLLPAGEGSRRAKREHRRLRAGVREADQIDARQALANPLGEVDLQLVRRGDAHQPCGLALHRLHDPRMAVAEDERRVVRDEVDALDAVCVPDAATRSPRDVDGVRVVEDRRPRVAARQRAERTLPEGSGRGRQWLVASDQHVVAAVLPGKRATIQSATASVASCPRLAELLADERQNVVRVGIATDHLLLEDELPVHVHVEDPVGAGHDLDRADLVLFPLLEQLRRQTGGFR